MPMYVCRQSVAERSEAFQSVPKRVTHALCRGTGLRHLHMALSRPVTEWEPDDDNLLLSLAPQYKRRRLSNGKLRSHCTLWGLLVEEFNSRAITPRSVGAVRSRHIKLVLHEERRATTAADVQLGTQLLVGSNERTTTSNSNVDVESTQADAAEASAALEVRCSWRSGRVWCDRPPRQQPLSTVLSADVTANGTANVTFNVTAAHVRADVPFQQGR